jgi:hypothetical protein
VREDVRATKRLSAAASAARSPICALLGHWFTRQCDTGRGIEGRAHGCHDPIRALRGCGVAGREPADVQAACLKHLDLRVARSVPPKFEPGAGRPDPDVPHRNLGQPFREGWIDNQRLARR